MLLPLYARREPTTDAATREVRRLLPGAFAGAMDVQLYRDAAATEPAGRYPHDRSNKPRAGDKTVMLNCCRWRLEWLPDAASDGEKN